MFLGDSFGHLILVTTPTPVAAYVVLLGSTLYFPKFREVLTFRHPPAGTGVERFQSDYLTTSRVSAPQLS